MAETTLLFLELLITIGGLTIAEALGKRHGVWPVETTLGRLAARKRIAILIVALLRSPCGSRCFPYCQFLRRWIWRSSRIFCKPIRMRPGD